MTFFLVSVKSCSIALTHGIVGVLHKPFLLQVRQIDSVCVCGGKPQGGFSTFCYFQ